MIGGAGAPPAVPVVSHPAPGVSFTPGGRTGTGGGAASKMSGAGSMESLNSTNSSTLSQYSMGSTISTGKGRLKRMLFNFVGVVPSFIIDVAKGS